MSGRLTIENYGMIHVAADGEVLSQNGAFADDVGSNVRTGVGRYTLTLQQGIGEDDIHADICVQNLDQTIAFGKVGWIFGLTPPQPVTELLVVINNGTPIAPPANQPPQDQPFSLFVTKVRRP